MNAKLAEGRKPGNPRPESHHTESPGSEGHGPAHRSLVDQLASALLYEGYILYPYRASAVKNQQRFNFGGLYPPAYSQAQSGTDACRMQTECLVVAGQQAIISVRVRFLHLVARRIGRRSGQQESPSDSPSAFEPVDSVEVAGRTYYAWQEAIERERLLPLIDLRQLVEQPLHNPFSFPAGCTVEPLMDELGETVAAITREQAEIVGSINVTAQRFADGLFRVRVTIENQTPFDSPGSASREQALLSSFSSTHTILTVVDGEFVSLLDPPDEFRAAVASCRNVGAWPVLVGEAGERDTLLASPIILYDYPQIAPESAGDLFDGTEIDEILTLRIMLLTDQEKREMCDVDPRARQILERTELLPPEQLWKMHGAVRGLRPASEPPCHEL